MRQLRLLVLLLIIGVSLTAQSSGGGSSGAGDSCQLGCADERDWRDLQAVRAYADCVAGDGWWCSAALNGAILASGGQYLICKNEELLCRIVQ